MENDRHSFLLSTDITLVPSGPEREELRRILGVLDQQMMPLPGSEPSQVRTLMHERLQAIPPPDLRHVTVTDLTLAARVLSVREYCPSAPAVDSVIVYLHGGGWVLGTVGAFDRQCAALAEATGCRVLSVDYRLAPEYPYPAALQDTLDVIHEFAIDAGLRYVLAGESAGGGLAISTVLALADAGAVMPDGIIAWYPVVAPTRGQLRHRSDTALLRTVDLGWFWEHYLSGDPADTTYAAPLDYVALDGLPPTMVILAERDPSRPEAIEFVLRLRETKTEVSVVDCRDLPHAFRALRTATGDATVELVARWLDVRRT